MIGYISILLAACAGVSLAAFIAHKKRAKETFVCPMKGECHGVITSRFGKFLGVPVEMFGIAYYTSIVTGYAVLLSGMLGNDLLLQYFLLLLTGGAFLFSAYLVFIQIAVLKQICTWCLTSAFLSTFIFVVAYAVSINPASCGYNFASLRRSCYGWNVFWLHA